ncbi:MAG: ammonium transporter, partial [Actinomycetia bacterium]|nr:ammonium transporter [Actinomycetes bacterium]
AAAGMLGWVITEWWKSGKPTALGAASGAVAGLVAATPAAGFIGPISALGLGFVAGAVCFVAVSLKWRLGYDDALDVVGVHLVGGTLGALATGFLATKAVNSLGDNGAFFGNPALLGAQAISVIATIAYAFVITVVLLKIIDAIVGLRVSEDDEKTGLDLSLHSEAGYALHG